MLECVSEKSECFNGISTPTINFIAANENGVYMELAVQQHYNVASLHVDIKFWNHSVLKELLWDWEALKSILVARGITKFVASNSDCHDKKWKKFIAYFGFPEPRTILMSEQEI